MSQQLPLDGSLVTVYSWDVERQTNLWFFSRERNGVAAQE